MRPEVLTVLADLSRGVDRATITRACMSMCLAMAARDRCRPWWRTDHSVRRNVSVVHAGHLSEDPTRRLHGHPIVRGPSCRWGLSRTSFLIALARDHTIHDHPAPPGQGESRQVELQADVQQQVAR